MDRFHPDEKDGRWSVIDTRTGETVAGSWGEWIHAHNEADHLNHLDPAELPHALASQSRS